MALNPKQTLFVKEYLVDQNATKAALRAGYSKKTAHSIGSENLQKPEIKLEIEKGLALALKKIERRAAKKGLTKERWLEELRLIGFSNMDDFLVIDEIKIHNGAKGKNGKYAGVKAVLTKDRSRKLGRVIKKLSETKNGIGIELHSKQAALELIGKHFGWVKETVEMTGKDGGPQVIITLPSNGREAHLATPMPSIERDEKKESDGGA